MQDYHYIPALLLMLITLGFVVLSYGSTDHLKTDDTLYFSQNLSGERGDMVNADHYSYCNHHKSVTRNEGTEMIGYSLQQVHIIVSPGQSDLSSTVKIPDQRLQPLACDISDTSTLKDFKETLDLHSEVLRTHPFHHLHPDFPKVCASNHLTSYGFKQLISIGQHLRTSYFTKGIHKRLVSKYSSINVESILTERSYHSVLGLLYGLLDEQQLLKTKIYEAERNFCVLTESNLSSCMCSKTSDLAPHVSQALAKGTYLFKTAFPGANMVKKIFQTDHSDQTSGLDLYNVIMQYKCENLSSLHSGDTPSVLLAEDNLAELYKILANYQHSLRTDTVFRTYSELRVYPFLQQILSRTSLLDEWKPVNVYMGHSHFLHFLTSTLGIFRQHLTPLASRFVIEVYKKNGGQIDEGEIYLRYLYNGDDVTQEVAGCTFHLENNLCKHYIFSGIVIDVCRPPLPPIQRLSSLERSEEAFSIECDQTAQMTWLYTGGS